MSVVPRRPDTEGRKGDTMHARNFRISTSEGNDKQSESECGAKLFDLGSVVDERSTGGAVATERTTDAANSHKTECDAQIKKIAGTHATVTKKYMEHEKYRAVRASSFDQCVRVDRPSNDELPCNRILLHVNTSRTPHF
jgi:hypothetical protein